MTFEEILQTIEKGSLATKYGDSFEKTIDSYKFFLAQRGENCPYTKMAKKLILRKCEELGICQTK